MAIGLLMYVVYRKAQGYSLTRTVEKVVVAVSMSPTSTMIRCWFP